MDARRQAKEDLALLHQPIRNDELAAFRGDAGSRVVLGGLLDVP
jgi:hypothetical protein